MPESPDGLAQPPLADASRLRLKPGTPASTLVDGDWWPASRDLATELPVLLAALTPLIGMATGVGYHRSGWDTAPDHLDIGDEYPLLQGWTADIPHSVVVIADSGQHITLLVVAPESTAPAAEQALFDACEPAPSDLTAGIIHSADRPMAETIDRINTSEHATTAADRDRIARWVDEAARQFADAPVQGFVPILTEHTVRSRLANSGTPTV